MLSKKFLLCLVILLGISLMLSACQTYQGYPTEVVQVTPAPTTTGQSSPEVRATIAPPPTFTPRPDLPPTPAGVKLEKIALVKEGLDALLSNYFRDLDSADVLEVALLAMQRGLEQSGISSPNIPLPRFGKDDTENWNLFQQAYTIILDKYKGKVSEEKLAQFILSGVSSSMQDCQTAYYPADAAENYAKVRFGIAQTLVGIGINLQTGQDNAGNNIHIITRAVSNGPAEKAGLKIGDRIAKVDGQATGNKTSTEVVQLIGGSVRGTAALGTKVSLTIQRGSQEQTVDLSRTQIAIPFIERQTLNGNIAYLRINRFPYMEQAAETSALRQFQTWVDDFNKPDVNGIVIDLRGNSYGNIGLVRTFLSYFINGQRLVFMSGAEHTQNAPANYGVVSFSSDQNILAIDKPISVIVDGATSGEAEIFAYAIQRNKRGTIVGTTTAGCANASAPVFLADKSLLNVTVYRAIANQDIEESILTSVEPDTGVDLDLQQLAQGKDTQIEAAIAELKK